MQSLNTSWLDYTFQNTELFVSLPSSKNPHVSAGKSTDCESVWGFGSSITEQLPSTLWASWSQDLVLGYRETKPWYYKWKALDVDLGQGSTRSRTLSPLSVAGGAFRSYAPTCSAIPPSAPPLTQLCHTQTGFLRFPSKSYISPYNRWIKSCLPSIHLSKFNPFFKTSVKSTSSLLRHFFD